MTEAEYKNAARQARNAYMRDYMREYRRKNPERVKADKERYWARKAGLTELERGENSAEKGK